MVIGRISRRSCGGVRWNDISSLVLKSSSSPTVCSRRRRLHVECGAIYDEFKLYLPANVDMCSEVEEGSPEIRSKMDDNRRYHPEEIVTTA
jgi:hypothetical protein